MTVRMDVFCPVCKSENDGHTDVSGADSTPSDGDISLCIYCGTISEYTNVETKPKLVEVTGEPLERLLEQPAVLKAVAIGRAFSEHHRG